MSSPDREAKVALSSSELVALADLNLAESLREHARWSASGVIDERGDTLRVVSNTRFAPGMFNMALRTGDGPLDAARWLLEQRDFFEAHGRGFSIYTRGERDRALAEACRENDFEPGDDHPGMARTEPLREPTLPPAVQLELVTTPALMADVIDLEARAYATVGLPDSVLRKVMSARDRLLRPHVLWLLARCEGAPAAAAMVLFSHTVAGLYWVATAPEFRARGLGEVCTRAATNAAFQRGARAIILQASQRGAPLYRRLGFHEITRYPWYWTARVR